MLALLAGAAATVAVLITSRPALDGSTLASGPASRTGDDLAIALLWWGAVIGTAWLAVTTLAFVAALARGRTRTAHRIARFAPPLARRLLQAALVSTWALVPAAAYATPPSGPITVHVDGRGHLTTETRRSTADDTPVVRTPETKHVTSTTSRAATIRRTTTTTSPAAPLPTVPRRPVTRPQPSPSPGNAPAPVAVPRGRVHVVVAGDNLWQIARAEVIRASGSNRPSDAQIAPYWQRVIAANQSTLRSGNPSLIFPGEAVTLP